MKYFSKHQYDLKKSAWLVSAALVLVLAVYGVNCGFRAYAATTASAATPCVSAAPPAQWKHVVVLMFENKTYSQVIGAKDTTGAYIAPYITDLAAKCGSAYSGTSGATPKNNWHDANYKASGTSDGSYPSKPNYATLVSGVSPSAHGLIDDTFTTTTGVDNIYNQLRLAGKEGKDYVEGIVTDPCSLTTRSSGDYHDAIRYYTNLGKTYCTSHDVNLTSFMTDVNNGALPAFSLIIPKNTSNMHDNSIQTGDTWAQNFLNPLFDSAQYKSGDTAVFFLWDEDTAIPNVLAAPSIVPGSKVAAPSGAPISHFTAMRTFEEMLGLPLIGDSAQAPSLVSFFNGGGTPPPPAVDNPPAVNITSPVSGSTITTSPVTVSANATDDLGVAKVEFYVGGTLKSTDTTAPYSYSWDTSALSGSQTLTAKAYDIGGNSATSSPVSVSVSLSSSCPSTPITYGSASTTVTIPVTGSYHVWSRIKAPDSANNSYYLQVDNACAVAVGDSATLAANAWSWLDYQDGDTAKHTTMTLSSGTHTLALIGREASVKLDRVLFLSDTCAPTGTGENCADATNPTVSLTAPAAGQTVTGTTTMTATASDNTGGSGLAKVEFYLDGNLLATSTSAPYQYGWNSTGVADGSHTAQAKAYDVAGNSASSVVNTFSVQNADTTPPSAPTNLSVTKNAYNEVDLAWVASTDNVAVAGYRVLRNNIVVGTVSASTTAFKDLTVSPNTSYTYTVSAYDAANNQSPQSSGVLVATPQAPDTSPPTAPASLTVTKNTYNEVDLTWLASSDNVGVTSYNVLRNGIIVGRVLSNVTSYNDTSVLPSTDYTYSVIASDAAGNTSPPSNSQSLTTPAIPDSTPPSAPSSLTSSVSGGQAYLSWTASSDNIGVAGYDIYRNNLKIATVNTTTFGDATVTAGQTYSYYVKAFDAAQNTSAASNTTSVTVPAVPPPVQTLTFAPAADATIYQAQPSRNYGTANSLRIDNSPVYDSLIKFTVTGVGSKTVNSAVLKLYVTNPAPNGGQFFAAASSNWAENTVVWNNAPPAGSALANIGAVNKGQWVSINLANLITADGQYSLRIKSTSGDGAIYSSKEASSNRPVLTLTVQ